jgi:hypothetical protein
VAKVFP